MDAQRIDDLLCGSPASIIVLRGSGGWADKIEAVLDDGHYLDDRKTVSIDFADTPDEVVERAFARAGNSSGSAQPD